jgi:hypothetical protein
MLYHEGELKEMMNILLLCQISSENSGAFFHDE